MSTRDISISLFLHKGQILDKAVFTAYSFDLICCYFFKVIPFSRCNSPGDIAGHHLPILLVILPLCLPLFWEELNFLDPLIHGVLDYHADGGLLRLNAMDGVIRANGWGFVSSLNEFIMCFQRAEMNMQGVKDFRDISTLQKRIFTGRLAIGIELYFKFGIFCVFSLFGFKGCCDLDKVWYGYISQVHDDMSFMTVVGSIFCSPLFIRALVYRVFILVMYPMMALRTFKKIKKFHDEGAYGFLLIKKIR